MLRFNGKQVTMPVDIGVRLNPSSTRPDCGMWFRTQRVVIEASETSDPLEGNKPIGQRPTITTSIPVQPADFQRVRLLRQETPKLQNTSPSGEMYNIEMEDRKNERRHQPARAFQIGNKVC